MSPRARRLLRFVLVAAQAVTVLITWSLWQARASPPNLPALPALPAVDMGAVVLATLALVLLAPRWGVPAHCAVLVLAMLLDQLRIQPEFVSMALLMWATWPGWWGGEGPEPAAAAAAAADTAHEPAALLIARAHLVALYFWAGLHKLLSADYADSASRFWQRTLPVLGEEPARALAWGVALFEIALGLALLWPAARRRAGWLAGAMHLGIFLSLSPLGRGRNEAVWPWNLALAVAAPVLLSSWNASWRGQLRASRPAALLLAAALLLSPALYAVGRLDAYLSYCLYSVNVPIAVLVRADKARELAAAGATELRLPDLNFALKELHVPFPPAHRLFEQYFARVAEPGDVLHIYDPRGWAARNGLAARVLTWPQRAASGGTDAAADAGEAEARPASR